MHFKRWNNLPHHLSQAPKAEKYPAYMVLNRRIFKEEHKRSGITVLQRYQQAIKICLRSTSCEDCGSSVTAQEPQRNVYQRGHLKASAQQNVK